MNIHNRVTNALMLEIPTLCGANLRGLDLTCADLSGACLKGADLRGARLTRASLGKADLSGAKLYNANLHGADLRGADLRYTDLRYADLSCSVLADADLRDAKCHYTVLDDAYVLGAIVRNDITIRSLRVFYGLYRYTCWAFVDQAGVPWVRMGCLWKTVADWDTIGVRFSNPKEFPDDKSEESERRARAFHYVREEALHLAGKA